MSDLFNTGIRPAIDAHIDKLSREKRDYGLYWSASSAGYCMRKNIFDRLQIPHTTEEIDNNRKQRIFSSGHIFHAWIQEITRQAGLSIAQELELQDEDLMIRGHIDDLVLLEEKPQYLMDMIDPRTATKPEARKHLILYDYKTRNSKNFNYAKQPSYFHGMQLGTYMYMLRRLKEIPSFATGYGEKGAKASMKYFDGMKMAKDLSEARTLNISKDDLRLTEVQYMYSDELEKEVVGYWHTLNTYWKSKTLPTCTCHEQAGGFMAKEKWNPYWFNGKPCSIEHFQKFPELIKRWKEA